MQLSAANILLFLISANIRLNLFPGTIKIYTVILYPTIPASPNPSKGGELFSPFGGVRGGFLF